MAVQPEEQTSGKPLMTGGIVLLSMAVGSAGLTYYTFNTRRETEKSLAAVEQSNAALVASGLPPQDTSELKQKIKLHRGLAVGFGIGAAVFLVTGGVLFLVGRSRQQQARTITWAPRMSGIEVSF